MSEYGEMPPDLEEQIKKWIDKTLYKPTRTVILRTGVGGKDFFDISMEEHQGFKRVYIGFKVLRILRKLDFKIHKSVKKQYYKLVKYDTSTNSG